MNGYCSDECQIASDCTHWNAQMTCGANTFCQSTAGFTCTPASTFHYGTVATGRCCQPGFDVANTCAGGLCESTGNITSNPFYCTQGCLGNGDCPIGYLCGSNFCWIAGSLTDPNNYTYSCMP